MSPLTWWAMPVWAEPPPARLCADAAEGTEIELCLQVAATHPQAVHEVSAALVARLDVASAPDRALLEALLWMGGPDGVRGVERLAELRDPRALPVLMHAVRTRELAVAQACVGAVVAWPETWPAVAGWMVDDGLPEAVQLAAAQALAQTGDPEAARLLEQALVHPRVPRQVHRRALGLLHRWFPGRPVPVGGYSRDAATWLAVGAGAGFGFAMGALGSRGPEELWPVAAITGLSAGVTVGWFGGKAWPMEPGEAALVTVGGLGAGAAGVLLGAAATPDRVEGALFGGVIGETAGFGAALALRRAYPGSEADVLEAAALGGLVTVAADGFLRLGEVARPVRLGVDGAVLATGMGAGLALAPVLDVAPNDAGAVFTGAAAGLAMALVVPVDRERRGAWLQAGPAAGAAVGLLVSDAVNLHGDVWFIGASSAGVGASLGGGLGLLVDDPAAARALALIGAGAGWGLGGWVAHRQPDPVDRRDVLLVAVSTGWVAVQAAAVGHANDGMLSRQEVGGVLLAGGLAAGVTSALSTEIDVSMPHVLSASSLGLWGAYTGGVVGQIGWDKPEIAGLVGTNVGLLGGALLVSDRVGVPPLVVASANAGAVIGASTTGLAVAAGGGDQDAALGSSLVGAAVGGLVGGALGRKWHRSGTRRDVAGRWRLPGRWSVVPGAAGASGLTVVVDRW